MPFPTAAAPLCVPLPRTPSAFQTWRSLCVDQALSDALAVELMIGMTRAAADG